MILTQVGTYIPKPNHFIIIHFPLLSRKCLILKTKSASTNQYPSKENKRSHLTKYHLFGICEKQTNDSFSHITYGNFLNNSRLGEVTIILINATLEACLKIFLRVVAEMRKIINRDYLLFLIRYLPTYLHQTGAREYFFQNLFYTLKQSCT